MPAWYPQSGDPKTSGRGWFASPLLVFLPGVPVIGFVAPSSVCQANCIAASALSGPRVGQRLARCRTRAFGQNTRLVVPSKPGCAWEKFPADVAPSLLPLEKTAGVKGGVLCSAEQEWICCQGDTSHRPAASRGTRPCCCRECGQRRVNSEGEREKSCLWK